MGIFKSFKDDFQKNLSDAFKNPFQKQTNNSLETPPPPPVPGAQKTMSVMVGVNGQSYGPYERATLLRMIEDGSLTTDTYVFMEGMSEWKKAGQVDEVAALFRANAPAPAVPPVPWAQNQQPAKPSRPKHYHHSFSDNLNSLIDAAVADGEISDLERNVLIRNAQAEGVSMDEFVMVLEARLYEQRRAIMQHNANKPQPAPQPVPQPVAATPPEPQKSALTKCPNCGAQVVPLKTKCPDCGIDYPSSVLSTSDKLKAMFAEIDDDPSIPANTLWKSPKTNAKNKLIQSFPVPSDKNDFIDFYITLASISDEFNVEEKCLQMYCTAKMTYQNDPAFISRLEEVADKYAIDLDMYDDED